MIRSTLRRMTLGRWPELRSGEPMTCTEVGRLLQRYLDDELHDDADPTDCGPESEVYRRIKTALASRQIDVSTESIERLRAFGEQLAEGT